jgi:hypothetical protein
MNYLFKIEARVNRKIADAASADACTGPDVKR